MHQNNVLMQTAPGVIKEFLLVPIGWEDFLQQVTIMMKELPKVLRDLCHYKWFDNMQPCEAIWSNIHGATINRAWTGVPRKVSPHGLRLMIKKVGEMIAVTRNELQDDLKAASMTAIQRTPALQPSLFQHCMQNLLAKRK